jgi:glycosyltransferase involved in cell wall biosynthesis
MTNPSDTPKVSIVITAYNAERFIGACVKAALAQTYPNFEVLLVDDGSTDRTATVCHSVIDPRFRYVMPGRVGRPKALNLGVTAASGEYIAINDADDLSLPHRLQYSMDFMLQHPKLAYLGSGFAATDTFNETIPDTVLSGAHQHEKNRVIWPSRVEVFRRNVFNNSTLLYPKSTWKRIGGYDEALSNSEDYDFYLRALQCGPAALLPGQTVLWYTNPNGFFKQKTKQEHLQALGLIKRRAHGLLCLPKWLRLYHPLWVVWFELVQRFPNLLNFARDMQKSSLAWVGKSGPR